MGDQGTTRVEWSGVEGSVGRRGWNVAHRLRVSGRKVAASRNGNISRKNLLLFIYVTVLDTYTVFTCMKAQAKLVDPKVSRAGL